MSDAITGLTMAELVDKLADGSTTSVEATNSYLDRIERHDKAVKAYVTVDREGALEQAEAADKARASGSTAPLLGVPVALKDIILQKGVRATCSSRMLENYVAPYDAFVTKQLREAGAVFLGKLNMDEFAMGSSCETSFFGPSRNPWNLTKTPGGSSGGSSAAVSADLAAASLGTDTGGSIRQPAAFCGIVGMKPTYGRISRFGAIAFASSLDQIGPMTKDVTDAALMMNVVAGHDVHDSTSADEPVPDHGAELDRGVSGMTLGVPKEYFVDGTEPGVRSALDGAIKRLEGEGATIREISLPYTSYGIPCYYVLAPAEASSNLARYDGVRYGYRAEEAKDLLSMYSRTRAEGFGPEVKRRIMLGTYALSSGYYDAYYLKGQKVRTLIAKDFAEAFKEVDAIVTPTSPTTAFGLGEKADDQLTMYLSDIFTINANLAGIPGLSVPCGFDDDGLPVGLQLMGRPFAEPTLLRVAKVVESTSGVIGKKPSIA